MASRPEPNAVARHPRLHGPGDKRHANPADGQAERERGQCARPELLEPVDDRHIDREEAAQARPEGDDEERPIEPDQRLDLAEEHEPDPEGDHADPDHALRPEPVDDPAKRRTQHGGLHRLQRGCAGQGGLAPAELGREERKIRAEGLVQQPSLQELDAAPGSHHPPAVEYFHGIDGRIAQAPPAAVAGSH